MKDFPTLVSQIQANSMLSRDFEICLPEEAMSFCSVKRDGEEFNLYIKRISLEAVTFIEQTTSEYYRKFGEDAPASNERVDDFLSEKLEEAYRQGRFDEAEVCGYDIGRDMGVKEERTRIIELVESLSRRESYPENCMIVTSYANIAHNAALKLILNSLKEESV